MSEESQEPILEEFHATKNGIEAVFRHPGVNVLACQLAEIFVKSFARNYVEQQLEFDPNASLTVQMIAELKVANPDPNFPGEFERVPLLLTVQHRYRKTPHELRKEAIAALNGLLRFVTKEDEEMSEYKEAQRVINEFNNPGK